MEKEYKSKKRILIGIIIVLIITNLSALGTWGFQKFKRNRIHQMEKERTDLPNEGREGRVKHYVKRELNLSEKQCSTYYKSMDENFLQSKIMVEKIAKCKNEIINQTLSDNPDTNKLNMLCDSLGYYHNRMQRGMNRHFLEVKKCLDSGQKTKLREMLIRMNEKEWNKDGGNQRRSKNGKCDD